ncbi:hypothetical protein ACFYVL_38110 [Streptomyces sp. NPDC004111]|uniref:hypothetical protein n=1 Tax=Streptomyces sp. NPDC004111 TaxID=3364690 RepID=UPI0036B6E287
MRRAPYVWIALAAVACGAVLCVLGWYGVSGERFTARQVPYLASCTLPGAALIVAGAVLLAGRDRGALAGDPAAGLPAYEDADGAGAEHGDGLRDGGPGAAADGHPPPSAEGPLLHLPGGTLAHRPDCPLVLGKAAARPAAGVRDLAPCPVCEPARLPQEPPSMPGTEG